MFGLFEEKVECPGCKCKINPTTIKVSRHRSIKVFNCPECKADFVKNKRSELFPVIDGGAILC